jgi:hypothetical protein
MLFSIQSLLFFLSLTSVQKTLVSMTQIIINAFENLIEIFSNRGSIYLEVCYRFEYSNIFPSYSILYYIRPKIKELV